MLSSGTSIGIDQRWFVTDLSLFVVGMTVIVAIFLGIAKTSMIVDQLKPSPNVKAASTQKIILPVSSTDAQPPVLSARSFIVNDVKSQTVLASNNPEERLLPASTTKIMTALIALDQYQLSDVVTVGPSVGNGQKPELIPGESLTVENLLYAMLINSDNDAAIAIADFDPHSHAHFIDLMNQKALILGLTNTHYVNVAGFDDPAQFTTVSDLAKLGAYAMSQPLFSRVVGTKASEIYSVDQEHRHPLTNINQLLGEIPGVRGIKTGYTEAAGENLVTDVVRDGHELIFVVLGSKDRFGETKKLIDWTFANFRWEEKEVETSPTDQ